MVNILAIFVGFVFGFWVAKTDGGQKDLIEEIKREMREEENG